MTRTITGKPAQLRLTPDDLDTLLDALDSVHEPHISQDDHDDLRRRLSVAYDRTQGL